MNQAIGNHVQRARALDIVAADDSRSQRYLLYNMLTSAGHRLRAAKDGSEAYQMATQAPPDLLITDLEMPGSDGFFLIDAVRHSKDFRIRNLPIIVCSSRRESCLLNLALDCGATSFVTKPLHRLELKLAIANLTLVQF